MSAWARGPNKRALLLTSGFLRELCKLTTGAVHLQPRSSDMGSFHMLLETSCLPSSFFFANNLINQVFQHLGLTSFFHKVSCMLLNVWLKEFMKTFL